MFYNLQSWVGADCRHSAEAALEHTFAAASSSWDAGPSSSGAGPSSSSSHRNDWYGHVHPLSCCSFAKDNRKKRALSREHNLVQRHHFTLSCYMKFGEGSPYDAIASENCSQPQYSCKSQRINQCHQNCSKSKATGAGHDASHPALISAPVGIMLCVLCRSRHQGKASSSSHRLKPSGSASSLSSSGSSRRHRDRHSSRSHRDDSVAGGSRHRSRRSSHRSSQPEPELDELGPRRASDPGAIWANEIADDDAMMAQPASPGIGPRAASGGLGAGSKAAWSFLLEKVSPGSARQRPPAHPSPGHGRPRSAASDSPQSRAAASQSTRG